MATTRVQIIGAAPIPKGHRVEVVWYRAETTSTGLFGGEKTTSKEIESPRVTDLDTNITYAVFGLFERDGIGYRAGTINLARHRLLDGLVEAQKIVGTVRACSIADIRFEGRGGDQRETELEIELD